MRPKKFPYERFKLPLQNISEECNDMLKFTLTLLF